MVAGYAVEEIIYNCKLPVDPYFPEWCGPPRIAFLPILIGPWLVATYLLARREAIVRSVGSGFTYGWFACVFMGLMWWLGFLAFVVLWIPFSAEETLLRRAVVGGAIAVPVIGFLTALVGSAIQVFIRWRRRKRLPQAA
jgi:predicted histidine transporter YuiF (NhaC family)